MSRRIHQPRQWRHGARARLFAAIAVLLLAVLPHATLAASLGHAGAGPVAGHHAAAAGAHAPCHGEDAPAPKPAPATPLCCIPGCGLMAAAPDPAPAGLAARWRPIGSAPASLAEGVPPEPAERPPRGLRRFLPA